ncbi:MFS transporter [Taibaiella lutea]|uniref:MFS transporter n=1 Tax=Taibaiella lutea TaxID=2608001 RepID=A0A5M6CNR1_9BACT|nr:MFS transporter [Taibaiella lutea]KAA5536851.1 MFS transporter [Taibaiella lutea]
MSVISSFPTQRYYRIAVSTFYFVQGIVFASWASRIPDVQQHLHLNNGELGGVLFALPIGQLTAMMLSGYLVNKLGSKRTLAFAALFYPGGLLLLGLAHNVWQLFAALFLFGVFGNLNNISVNAQGVGVERLYRRSIMASFHGLWSLAGFVGGMIAALMVSYNVSPLLHFVYINVLTAILIFIGIRFVVPRDARPEQESGGGKKFVMPDAFIFTLGLIAFACMICEGTMFDWSGIYFETIIKAPKDLTRLGYIAFMSTMAGGRFISDAFVTRFGVTRILRFSGIVILSGMLLIVCFPDIPVATTGFLLVGIGTSSVVPLVYSLAGKSKTFPAGTALAMVASIGFLGFLIGPPLIGFIAQLSNLRISFTIIAFLGLGTTLLAKRLSGLNK